MVSPRPAHTARKRTRPDPAATAPTPEPQARDRDVALAPIAPIAAAVKAMRDAVEGFKNHPVGARLAADDWVAGELRNFGVADDILVELLKAIQCVDDE